jgi:hypothetical protein
MHVPIKPAEITRPHAWRRPTTPRLALPNRAVFRSRRRLRRRWPGSHAGLCLDKARPAQAGPQPQGRRSSGSHRHTTRCSIARPPRSRLSNSRSPPQGRPPGVAIAIRLRRPLDPPTAPMDLGACEDEGPAQEPLSHISRGYLWNGNKLNAGICLGRTTRKSL